MRLTSNGIAILDDDLISNWVKQSGRLDHDQNMLPLVIPFIKPGSIVIDAGAFIGDHTIAYAEAAGLDGLVFAFEPSKEAFKCLERNLQRMPNTTCFNKGLGSKTETKGIEKVPGNLGMNHISEGSGVSVVSIDELDMFGIDFIKIDCEGYELEILKGAKDTIEKFRPVMLIEVNKSALKRQGLKEKDIFQFLEKAGYEYKNIYPGQLMTGDQYDIICEPK